MSPRKVYADQADIGTPLVRELVAAQFPQWAALPLEPIDSGGLVNAIYRLGPDLSVRLPLRPSTAGIVQREQAKLAALAPFLPVAIPSVEAIGTPTKAYPGEWSIHRWLPGAHPSPSTLVDPRGLATDLAAFIDAFRQINLPDRPPAYPGERRTRAPMASLDSPTRKAIDDLADLIDTRAALASWEESLAAPYDGREVWVHSDLTPSNLLVSPKGRLTAVLDFETSGLGDPACDLFPIWYLLPATVHPEFRTTLNTDPPTWLRGRGRVLSQALTVLHHLKDTNPALATSARHAISNVLATP
ncbi:aminoglycoside phosphotransferase family protein [Kribbella jiaozuonensis]|uniref:Aminoglycoside phosphotransferase family protein n=1 Tax=Kribbella jiaozuonensis TaxID=2575441 RepID=A0A4U3M6G1_9ACTN|nr:aminoglycoside phosphotransferase family protein [Kribbella jiaozuonensis]TKK83007.1 aminoglycoside phosphotransferase family protein [Kribbella jiaozuonensis]